MVGSLIAFRSRRFIACHSKPSVLNNAGVMWCAKESRMRVRCLDVTQRSPKSRERCVTSKKRLRGRLGSNQI